MTDEEIVERCQRGDHGAQQELYHRTIDRIYGLFLKMTNSEEDAFDLAQETYVRAFTHIEGFDGRSSVQTWLYRIALNESLQFLRRTKVRRKTLLSLAANRGGQVPSDNHQGDKRLDIADALKLLSKPDQVMLVLRYQQGLDYHTIADVVGCAEGTVASRLNRSRKRLRELLEPSYGIREERPATQHQRSKPVMTMDDVAEQPPTDVQEIRDTGDPT